MTTGTGAAVGAALSGWLYPLGGFLLPMTVGAVLPLAVLPIARLYLPRSAAEGGPHLLARSRRLKSSQNSTTQLNPN